MQYSKIKKHGTRQVFLYSRNECELCDQVQQLINKVLTELEKENPSFIQWAVQPIDINTDAKLLEKYAWHIPVLQREDNNNELFWPFPKSRLRTFLLQ